MVQLSYLHMTTGKNIALTIWTFINTVISLLFHTLSRFVITFLPRSKLLLISRLQSSSASDFRAQEEENLPLLPFFPLLFVMKWWDQMPWPWVFFFKCWVLSQFFHSPLSHSSRGSLVRLHFLPLEWYHLLIWGCEYFSRQSWFQLVTHPAQHFPWCTLHIS